MHHWQLKGSAVLTSLCWHISHVRVTNMSYGWHICSLSGRQIHFCAAARWLPTSPLCSAGLLGKVAADQFGAGAILQQLQLFNFNQILGAAWPRLPQLVSTWLLSIWIYINVKEARSKYLHICDSNNTLTHNIMLVGVPTFWFEIWDMDSNGSYELACLPLFCDKAGNY